MSDLSPSLVRQHKGIAETLANKIKYIWFPQGIIKSWSDLEAKIKGIPIPQFFTKKSFDENLHFFCHWLVNSVEERLRQAVQAAPVERELIDKNCQRFGDLTLLPEQQGTSNELLYCWEEGNNATLNIATAGGGKTPIAIATLRRIWDKIPNNAFQLHRVIILTKKPVRTTWIRHLKRMGFEKELANGEIFVSTYSEMTSSLFKLYMTEKIVNSGWDDEKITYEATPLITPSLVWLDEVQCVKRWSSRRSKFVEAWIKVPTIRWFACSATPFITINDTRNFTLMCKAKDPSGMIVTSDTFPQFAKYFSRDPAQPNDAAMERYREYMAQYIVITPKVRWPHKARNFCTLCTFENEASRNRYRTAEERYIQMCQKMGKDSSGINNPLTVLTQYSVASEPERVPFVVNSMWNDIHHKMYPIALYRHRQSVIKTVMGLHKRGLPRNKISIIWGGAEEIDQRLLLSQQQVMEMAQKALKGIALTRKERKALITTVQWQEDKARNEDLSDEAQRERYGIMEQLGLYDKQDEVARQIEVDRFTEGDTMALVGTIAAGGVGLSFDHSMFRSRKRRTYTSLLYSMEDFIQALCRGMRRMSLSDIDQSICLLKGTIEETHMGPILDRKLRSWGTLVKSGGFDVIDLMNEIAESYATGVAGTMRTKDEVDPDDEENRITTDSIPDEEDEDEI